MSTIPDALSWEASLAHARSISERRAWRVAWGACLLASVSVVCITLMLPLRRVVPYVISLDRLTGESEVVSLAVDEPASARLIEAKYWVTQYVRTRERYDANWLDIDFVAVHRWSAPAVLASYDARFTGADAWQRKLGAHAIYRVVVISVGLADASHAVVRFERHFESAGALPVIEHFAASLSFELKPVLIARERDLIENPLGLRVTSYRLDPELTDPKEAS